MLMTKMSTAALLAAGALFTGGSVASAAHVDFFDAGPFSIDGAAGGVTETQTVPPGASGALGGLRQVTINSGDNTGTPVTGSLSVDDPDVSDDAVQIALGSSDSPGSVIFEYGDFTTAGDLNADFLNIPASDGTDSGLDWTMLNIALTDVTGSGAATVTLTSGSGTSASTLAVAFDATDSNTNLSLPYSGFLTNDPTLDLLSIDGVSLQIEGDPGLTAGISFFGRAGSVPDDGGNPINVIPTPAALPAGLAALAVLGLRRRRCNA